MVLTYTAVYLPLGAGVHHCSIIFCIALFYFKIEVSKVWVQTMQTCPSPQFIRLILDMLSRYSESNLGRFKQCLPVY